MDEPCSTDLTPGGVALPPTRMVYFYDDRTVHSEFTEVAPADLDRLRWDLFGDTNRSPSKCHVRSLPATRPGEIYRFCILSGTTLAEFSAFATGADAIDDETADYGSAFVDVAAFEE